MKINIFKSKQLFTILLLCFTFVSSKANDSSYYGSGNQLIPISESDISVQKEILSITRNTGDDRMIDVSVYYEFFNPGKEKTLTVGFEAFAAHGDADFAPHIGGQPYMSDFKIDINNKELPYQVAVVSDSVYYKNGVINALTEDQIKRMNEEEDYPDYFYVYSFGATFKPGLNIVKHSYKYELSGSISELYSFDYVLSAAMRWANKQIDDFTLHIDMGHNQLITIPKTFFESSAEWIIDGIGKTSDTKQMGDYYWIDNTSTLFFIKEGKLTFRKKNFKPRGELSFSSPRALWNIRYFDSEINTELPYEANFYSNDIDVANELSQKILRNLPFACKGYIFLNPQLQSYYEQQIWYYPNDTYRAEIENMTEEERDWINHWTHYQIETIRNNVFDYKNTSNIIYYQYLNSKIDLIPANDMSKKILRNLPFAYRGYVFSSPTLQHYFEQQSWYYPHPEYKAEPDQLSDKEKQWLQRWSD